MRVLRGRLSVCECASFPFGFEGRMWDLIALVPDNCLSFYFICLMINHISLPCIRLQSSGTSEAGTVKGKGASMQLLPNEEYQFFDFRSGILFDNLIDVICLMIRTPRFSPSYNDQMKFNRPLCEEGGGGSVGRGGG